MRVGCRDLLKHHGVSVATADVCRFGRHSDELLELAVGGHADFASIFQRLAS